MGTEMKPDTPYFIASITKMFTAAIILRLHELGKIDLDAPISDYLDGSLIQGIHVYKGADYSQRIKVCELVSQTSGIADFETDKRRGGISVMDQLKSGQDRFIDTEQALEITRGLTPRFPPGTPGKAHYSNTNYRLLGEIIEAITSRSMAENFEQLIYRPLNLTQTYLYDWSVPDPDETPATIYLKDEPALVPKYLSSNVSDGGLVSTASECMTFLRAFFEGQLFDLSIMERVMTWNSIFFPLRYGYGLMYFKLPRFFWIRPLPEYIGHSGSTGSFAFVCPSKSIYLVGTINQIASPSRPFLLMNTLIGAAS
jgi:CubicO group peptidase (beta-lactamase class C family)